MLYMYRSQCYSLKSPHSLLPPLCPQVCCLCLCPFLPCKLDHQYYLSRCHIYIYIYICINIWYLSFFFWLTSLCIIGSRFIHLIRTDSNVFLLIAGQYSIVCMYHNFLTHSSVDGHLGYFHVLAIVKSAAMNTGVKVGQTTSDEGHDLQR